VAGLKLLPNRKAEAAEPPPPLAEPSGAVLVRMQQELEQAVSSGRTPKWLMVVDTRKCIGCDACSVACRAENPTAPGHNFRRVIQRELGGAPRPWAIFKPVNCLQCEDPPCAAAVPEGMIRRRPDGIVEFDLAMLKGTYAKAAAEACPFELVHVDDGKTFTASTPRRRLTNIDHSSKTAASTPGNPARTISRTRHGSAHFAAICWMSACCRLV